MSEQFTNLEILSELFEPATVGVNHGEEIFTDTSDPGEGDFRPPPEPFTGYDASTRLAPVAIKTLKTIVLEQAASAISHPKLRVIKIVDFSRRIPRRNTLPAA